MGVPSPVADPGVPDVAQSPWTYLLDQIQDKQTGPNRLVKRSQNIQGAL